MLLRTSPLHNQLQLVDGTWQQINQMPTIVSTPTDTAIASCLGIADLSFLTRFGVKGKNAAAWLASQHIPVPPHPNTWCPTASAAGLVARLGMNEFLVEDSIASQLSQNCQQPPAKVYPVLRQDAAIALCGEKVNKLLLQTCNFNFRALSLTEHPVILTSMVGVAVIIIPGEIYRIWCDGTYGAYLWRTLVAIAQEFGGKVVGARIFSNLEIGKQAIESNIDNSNF